ncbi:MAG: GyrI-like domain-containing protein, partial [Bacteroidota bacterium]
AGPKGLMTEENKVMTVYHDSFKFTAPHKVRMSAALSVQEKMNPKEKVSYKEFEPGKCICARFQIGVQDFEKSWTGLFLWMNENGFKKSEKDPFEIYHNNFNEHPEGLAIVDFCVPVV